MRAYIICLLLALIAWNSAFGMSTRRRLPHFQSNHKKIIGGESANPGEFPYQVSVQHKGILGQFHICGGSILNPSYILTAAHCIANVDPDTIYIVAGVNSLTDDSGTRQEIKAKSIVIHDLYNDVTNDNDIALIKLEVTLELNDYVLAVDLPEEAVSEGTDCTMTGWGALSETGDITDILQKVVIPVISRTLCKIIYGDGAVSDGMICAGLLEGGADACYGDRGGPLQCQGLIQGISSWGYGCAEPSYPGVYTKVANYVEWIGQFIDN
ncbi:Trypsin-2 [Halocaridina rubra]|uniref:Trypsin-2 n=1 Tax=Halocaridina rubra TaxID=373956 RepID=A0AAN8WLD4_HALRR